MAKYLLALTYLISFFLASSIFTKPVLAQAAGLTTVCQFTSGPRTGTSFDFATLGIQGIPVGSPCTDGQGSNGSAVGGGTAGGVPPTGNLTTVCQFTSGPKSGTTFDFAPFGVQPIQVGLPCTDGQGNSGISIASMSGGGGYNAAPNSGVTTRCAFSSGPKSGTTLDFAPYGVQPIRVGLPCTDGQGNNGVAVP